MSVFQIPGLGQAKPNETLPPLPSSYVASASAQDNKTKDATIPAAPASNDIPRAQETEPSDAMAVDQAESPPSLTGALEAALGGLDEVAPAEPAAQEAIPLGPDQSEHPEWEVDSSPYESSSESSSSSSSDDEGSDLGYELLGIEETARLLMEIEGGSDDEGERGGKASASGYARTKNELPAEAIPKPDINITPEMKIEELGAIEHMVDNIILVKAFTPGEYQVLDTGSVLCTAERVVVGAIAETIGKVLQPMYTVMFSSQEEIQELGLQVGTTLYYPPDHASFVFTQPLKNIKGSDASNLHDEEVADEEMEFSDDEKEAEFKRSLKQKKKDKWKTGAGKEREPHPLRQETSADQGLKYDDGDGDDDDGPYKPLARPAGFGTGPVSVEKYEARPRPNFQRGRGRDSRGRGGRGGKSSGRSGRGGPQAHAHAPRDGYSLPPQGPQQFPPPPPPAATGAIPPLPNFGFPLPGWPNQPLAVPPPPPPVPAGWSAPPVTEGQQAPNAGAFINPAFFAALVSQMQAQSGHGAWGQHFPQPPPDSGH